MNLPPPTIGLVALARQTFDTALAAQVADQARGQLATAGLKLRGPAGLVSDLDTTNQVAQELAQQPLDLLVILQATFADSTMAKSLTETVDAPLLLWAIPEAGTGGRLRLNSLCGINLATHALTRHGLHYTTLYANPGDETIVGQILVQGRAGRVRRLLREARIGRIGENPAGFDSCLVDPPTLRRQLGLEVVQVDLNQVFAGVRSVSDQATNGVRKDLEARVQGLDQVDQLALNGTLRTYQTLHSLAEQERLQGLAVRCWPEFFTELGCAACGAMSMLSNGMTPCSCEVDVNGTITQLILQWLSGEPAFGTDMVSVYGERDAFVLWHCGLAPLSMADPAVQPRATIHSNRQLPLLMEFTLKPGPVTVARLSEATGSLRLVVGRGTMLSAPPQFSGTSGLLRFDPMPGQPPRYATDVLDTILNQGLEHHISLTYGDVTAELVALADMLGLPVLYL